MKGEFLNRHKFSVLVITLAFSATLGLATFTGLDYYKTAKDIRAKEQETADKLAAAQQKVWAEKAALRKKVLKDYNRTIIVINKKHCFEPKTWQPNDLAPIEKGISLRKEAAAQYNAMKAAAAQAKMPLASTSGYRSYNDQVETYDYWVKHSNQKEADSSSARPGCSEHQTGLAVDLKADNCVLQCFATTSTYKWLAEHAAEYGFIQRYPDNAKNITGYVVESWHWRYVGRETAQDMKKREIKTLEEYFNVTGGDYSN